MRTTRWRSSGAPARPAMIRFWSLRSVMRPSFTPELNRVVMPCTTAGWSSRMALAGRPGREAGGRELLQPVRQRGGVTGVEHGGELTHQMVGAVQFWAVLEQPRECLGCACQERHSSVDSCGGAATRSWGAAGGGRGRGRRPGRARITCQVPPAGRRERPPPPGSRLNSYGREPVVLTTKEQMVLKATLSQFPPRADLCTLEKPVELVALDGDPDKVLAPITTFSRKVGGL